MKLLCYGVIVACAVWVYNRPWFLTDESDFGAYRQGSAGVFPSEQDVHQAVKDNVAVYVYPRWTAVFFRPFNRTGWLIFSTIAILLTAGKVLSLPYGWILVLGSVKPIMFTLADGNVDAVLPLLVFTPLGVVLASCFKLWCLGFLPLHFAVDYLRHRKSTPTHIRLKT